MDKNDRLQDHAQPNFSRSNISNLSKAYYSDEGRYSGLPKNKFELKLSLLEEHCDQASVPDKDRQRAFSFTLTGRSRHF